MPQFTLKFPSHAHQKHRCIYYLDHHRCSPGKKRAGRLPNGTAHSQARLITTSQSQGLVPPSALPPLFIFFFSFPICLTVPPFVTLFVSFVSPVHACMFTGYGSKREDDNRRSGSGPRRELVIRICNRKSTPKLTQTSSNHANTSPLQHIP